jgi:GntR family transcriptional repressor for pyruvate dehydrogenase complex
MDKRGVGMLNEVHSIEPVSKDLLYMKIADAIHNYIHVNKLKPGDKIPSERDLARQFKTGRNSVREALRILENESIVEVKTGKGVFVVQNSELGSIYLKLIKVNFMELLDTKMILEKAVIEYAIKKASPAQLQKLEAYLSAMELEASQGVFDPKNDHYFHRSLLEIRNNKMVLEIVLNLIKALDKYADVLDNVDSIWLNTVPYHRDMFEAIKNGDKKAAFDAYDQIYNIDIIALNTARDIT